MIKDGTQLRNSRSTTGTYIDHIDHHSSGFIVNYEGDNGDGDKSTIVVITRLYFLAVAK